ncbi:hypothetical protein ACIHJG_35860 [Streptomyces sp. NPDC052415]|uniref:hypothetical protein n=1 Tax=Streptomyces sp. NPDC052415 TaxID=3365690 RepID=UPI0037D70A39
MDQQSPVIEQVPFGAHFDYPADQPLTPYERERRDLLTRYGRFAQERGRMIESYLIRPPGATDQLVVELFDATNAQLVVTCATLQRDNGGWGVWYAIGTVADLARFLPSPTRNILVLPTAPDSDLDGLCTVRSITPVWPADDTDTFTSHQAQARSREPLFYPNGEPSL